MRKQFFSALVVSSLVTTACVHNPAKGLTTLDGQTLSVEPTYSSYARTSETQFHNADGSFAGSSSTVVGYDRVRTGFQYQLGGNVIDAQDYYQLAGDQATVDRIKRRRQRGVMVGNIGILTVVGSLAGAVLLGIKGHAGAAEGLGLAGGLIGTLTWASGRGMARSSDENAETGFKAIGQSPASWAIPGQ
jgi:hypothetical protein